MSDLKFAFRQLLKNPGFTAVAVLTLALGIGATTAIFSVTRTLLFDPLPVSNPKRFVELFAVHKKRGWSTPSLDSPTAIAVRQQTNLFARLGIYQYDDMQLRGNDFPETVTGLRVTPEFFSLWTIRPMLGRVFANADGLPGNDEVIILSHRLWQSQLGGDPAIIGRVIHFIEKSFTVVGVMPPYFRFPTGRDDYWRPFDGPPPLTRDVDGSLVYGPQNIGIIAELKPGIRLSDLQVSLDQLAERLAVEHRSTAEFALRVRRVASLPGIEAVGISIVDYREWEVSANEAGAPVTVQSEFIGTELANPLPVLRVPLRQGRWLDRADASAVAPRVLVNESAAKRLWPGENPLGKKFWVKARGGTRLLDSFEVVGVVGDTRLIRYDETPRPTVFRAPTNRDSGNGRFLVVRTAARPVAFYDAIRREIKAAGADDMSPEFYSLEERLYDATASQRTLLYYLASFAGVGLLLSAIGIYGVLAYSVGRRTKEIGIRMALGAARAEVMRLIVAQGMRLAGFGVVVGLAGAVAGSHLLRSFLFGIGPNDPVTFICVAILVAAVALLACWLPARRATKVNPMEALRNE